MHSWHKSRKKLSWFLVRAQDSWQPPLTVSPTRSNAPKNTSYKALNDYLFPLPKRPLKHPLAWLQRLPHKQLHTAQTTLKTPVSVTPTTTSFTAPILGGVTASEVDHDHPITTLFIRYERNELQPIRRNRWRKRSRLQPSETISSYAGHQQRWHPRIIQHSQT